MSAKKLHVKSKSLTSVCVVKGGEGDGEEGGGVFAGVDQVREGTLGVTVTPQALYETEPGGQALDHSPHAVRVSVAFTPFCEG